MRSLRRGGILRLFVTKQRKKAELNVGQLSVLGTPPSNRADLSIRGLTDSIDNNSQNECHRHHRHPFGMTSPFAVFSTYHVPPRFLSVTPSTAFRKKKLPPFGTHKSWPRLVLPSSSSLRSTSIHFPCQAKLWLSTLVLRSPMRKTSSMLPTNSSNSSTLRSSRQVSVLPHSVQKPRRPEDDEENSLNGAAGIRGLDGDAFAHFSCEGRTVIKFTIRLPVCLRHWVHWHVWA